MSQRSTPLVLICPCGSDKPYAACCGYWHAHPQQVPHAEALMRSRYSAFVFDKLDYLLTSWHPDTRPSALSPNPTNLKWLGLTVKNVCIQDANHASVEFIARSRLAGRAHRLHEISRFCREHGQWFYLDGEQR